MKKGILAHSISFQSAGKTSTMTKQHRNAAKNVARNSTGIKGTTRALIERSRSAISRQNNGNLDTENDSLTTHIGSASNGKPSPKKGVFAKANERKKRSITPSTRHGNNKISKQNSSSLNGASPRMGNNANEEAFTDDDDMIDVAGVHDIDKLNDLIGDKELTETNIDDMNGTDDADEVDDDDDGDSMNVEFIGMMTPNLNPLNDNAFRQSTQTLPRSYKVHSGRGKDNGKNVTFTDGINCHEQQKQLSPKFDVTKSVKTILTVQEKLTQDFPSLPPQVT